MWGEQQKLVADNPAPDFGRSVSMSTAWALIGAPTEGYLGSAYVFVHENSAWTQERKLVASGGYVDDGFGSSVSLHNDLAIVGAPGPITGSSSDAVYVFARDSGAWPERQKLLPIDGPSADGFGISVSVSSDTLIVGSRRSSAYVFVRDGTNWSEQQLLVPNGGVPSDAFGTSVSVQGDTAVIGAPNWGNGLGAAYVFIRSGVVWYEQGKLVASDSAPGDRFGTSVAVRGDTAVVGAPFGGGAGSGSAYVFTRLGGTWSEHPWHAAGGFGTSVSVFNDHVLVGAPMGDAPSLVHAFLSDGSGWTQRPSIQADDATGIDRFGWSVSASDDRAVVGAPWRGAAYVVPLFLEPGTPCRAPTDCRDGLCVDGYCCDTACDGASARCDAPGSSGTCTAALRGSVGSPEWSYECDGESTDCRTRCMSDAQCAPGTECDVAHGTCALALCDGDHTLRRPNGAFVECAPYRCTSANRCSEPCTSAADCMDGFRCSSSGRCTETNASENASCGVCASRERHETTLAFLALGALVMLLRRRS